MLVLQADLLKKSYGEKTLFDGLSFSIQDTEKIGLIGVNGTGKTSLLNALGGVEAPDSGTIHLPKGMKVSYLSQNPTFPSGTTVLSAIFSGDSPVLQLVRDYEDCLDELALYPENGAIERKLVELHGKMDAADAWSIENQVKSVLTELKITQFHTPIENLSGGQKKRVALAAALIHPCDLLILDEPTNHMDSETVAWLESYLKARKGALLMVTHDRYFLDRVVNKTFELDRGELFTYTGNYTEFLEKKAERKSLETAEQSKLGALYRRELEWIRRGAKARTTKQKARIDRFENIKGGLKNLDEENVEISVAHSRLGSKILVIDQLSMAYGNLKILDDFSYTMLKDDRIGIVGPSGIGKTTLLKLITGAVNADKGTIELGATVKLGYFSQDLLEMDESLRAIDWIKQTAEFVENGDGERISASQMMERFLFDGVMQYTYISRLSGGEKRRLYLMQVLMGCPNVLLLDEPTNDLDIETLRILEDYLRSFRGAVVIISHDRYFLDQTCDLIWAFQGDGKVRLSTGNYSDYLSYVAEEISPVVEIKKEKPKSDDRTHEKKKITYKESFELKTIDEVVLGLENQLEMIENKIKAASSDFVLLTQLLEEKESVETELLEKMERQEYLHSLVSN